MIRNYDCLGVEHKEAETPEEFLLLEIERLRKENEGLKQQVLEANKKWEENHCISFAFLTDGKNPKGKYIVDMSGNKIVISEYKEEENET